MMTRHGTLPVLAAAFLAGCAADGERPPQRLAPGAVVELHQTLAVPAGQARVFLQHGAVVAKHRLDQYRPHCNIEQRAVSDGTAVIAADRFTVQAVSVGEDYVVQRRARLYAALRLAGDDEGAGMVSRYIHHRLESPRQPQVLRLTCHGGFELPGRAQLPGLDDIRAALGRVAGIEPR